MSRPDLTDPHELTRIDLEFCGYHAARPVLAELRALSPRKGVHHLGWSDDPIHVAARHMVAALVALRQAHAQRVPGAGLMYQAMLAVVGGMSRQFRHSFGVDIPRTGTR